jgi:O-antigen/teichoic acid export membrane protein
MNFLARLRQIALVSGVETFGVAVGGIAGLLIVNVLPKDQYAVYTFLLACMTLMSGISDLGLGHCVLPLVGERTREVRWVVGVCHQIFKRRWMLLAAGGVVVVPYWLYTSWQHGWLGAWYVVASLLVVATVLLTLRDNYLHIILLILGHISTVNRIAFSFNLVRFMLVGAVLLLPLGGYTVAALMAASALATGVAVALYRRAFGTHQVPDEVLTPAEQKGIDREGLRVALPLVPSAVFYQVQGVITVLIVSLFGTTDMMAEVGAFGRLALILIVADRVTNMLLFPAIARAPSGASFVVKLLGVHAAYLGLMLVLFVSSLVFPHYWMLLLGRQYASMESLLWMVFLAFILMNASGFAFRTLTVRGATKNQGYTIPLVILVQIAYVAWVGVGDLRSVLGFNLVTSLVHFLCQYGLLGYRLPQWRVPRAAT